MWDFSLYMVMGTIMGIDIWMGAKSMGHNYHYCHNNNSCRNSYSNGSRKWCRTTIGAFKVPLFRPIIEYINITIKWFLRAKSGIMDRIMKQLIVN